jgi:DTW domain-containing protein
MSIYLVDAARCVRSSCPRDRNALVPRATRSNLVSAVSTCPTCRRPTAACVCDRIVTHETTRRVLILQHPQEQDAILGSAQLLVASLPKAKLVVGLSWPNFAAALGEEDADPKRWAVLFPDRESPGDQVRGRRGRILEPSELEGIVVLDGTWSKAKTLWWRNPWLLKLNRLSLKPGKPSIYGRLRAEPQREYVSTLESVAAALTLCGESPDVAAGLERVFRTLVQRVRDAHLIPPPAKRPPPKDFRRRPRRRPEGEGKPTPETE